MSSYKETTLERTIFRDRRKAVEFAGKLLDSSVFANTSPTTKQGLP